MCTDAGQIKAEAGAATALTLQNNFRALRKQTVDELNALADDFEKGNRRGQKGKLVGATIGIAGAATALMCGLLSGANAAAVPVVVAAKVLIGAKVATGSGSATACGFSIGAHGKNRRRRRAAEACLQNEREEMEILRRKLDTVVGDKKSCVPSQQCDRIELLSAVYGLGALGFSMSPEVIAGHADIISSINTVGADGANVAAVNLSEIPHDRVLELVQQLDLPFLRGAFECLNAPGADTAIEACGEMIFNQLIPLSAALLLPVQVVLLAVEARGYHKKHYCDAANVLRELARKKEEDGRAIDELVELILGEP